jgi:hypothetical protein
VEKAIDEVAEAIKAAMPTLDNTDRQIATAVPRPGIGPDQRRTGVIGDRS